MSSNQYTVNIVNADELYIGGRKIEALELGVLVSDDPTYGIGIGTDKPRLRLDISGNDGIRIPVGTTSERPDTDTFLVVNGINVPNGATNLLGILRYNTTTEKYEAVCNSESLSVDPSWCNFVIETGTVGNNKVGINTGTVIPSQTLDVSGQIGINDYIIHNGNTDTKIGFPTNDTLTITTNGTERMRVDSSGNVGIGVGHPQTTKSELHVKGSISVYKNARNTLDKANEANIYLDVGTINEKGSGIIWKPEYDDGGNRYTKDSAGIYFQRSTAGFITGGLGFYTNDSATYSGVAEERMRIDASGNVGIGITSPGAKLEVSGDARIGWISGSKDGLWLSNSHTSGVYANSPFLQGVTSGFAPKNISLNPGGGNVGIGTTSPGEKLEVSGNIIIGTTSSLQEAGLERGLHINSTVSSLETKTGILMSNNTGSSINSTHAAIFTNRGSSDTTSGLWFVVKLSGSSGFSNLTGHTRMVINNVGNVGIGTTSPDYKLEVSSRNGVGDPDFRTPGNAVPYWYGSLHCGHPDNGGITMGRCTRNGANESSAHYNGIQSRSTPNSSSLAINPFGGNVRICGGGGNVSIGPSENNDYKLYVTGPTWLNGQVGCAYNSSFNAWGTSRFKWPDHGGGWYMKDSSWIRTDGGMAVFINGSTDLNWYGHKKVYSSNYSFFYRSAKEPVSIECTDGGVFDWLGVNSDRRIKKNIVDIQDDKALNMLRNIPVRYYNYKDPKKPPEKVLGFIAQEVREKFPSAVKISPYKKKIPSILKNVKNPIWTETDLSENKWMLTQFDVVDASGVVSSIDISSGVIYTFYCSDYDDDTTKEENIEIIADDNGHFLFKKKWAYLYLYGICVEDFLTIDKQKLFALNFSASQEIDRIQQQEKAKLTAAEAKLTAAEAEIATLKTTLTDVLSRLAALEI